MIRQWWQRWQDKLEERRRAAILAALAADQERSAKHARKWDIEFDADGIGSPREDPSDQQTADNNNAIVVIITEQKP